MGDQGAYDLSLLVAVELLRECRDALCEMTAAALTVVHRLEQPYKGSPDRNPWETVMRRPADRAFDLSGRVQPVVA